MKYLENFREKKLLYDKNYIEQLYKEYQDIDVDDEVDLKTLEEVVRGRKVLLIGPGLNIQKQSSRIKSFIEKENPIIISVNFIAEEFGAGYIFLSNSKRYVQLSTSLSQKKAQVKVIGTSNVTKTNGKFDYTLNYGSLLDENAEVIDNSFIMFLKVMRKIGVHEITLAGFDGYSGNKNYINPNMEYNFDEEHAQALNKYVAKVLNEMESDMKLNFLTDSLYAKGIKE